MSATSSLGGAPPPGYTPFSASLRSAARAGRAGWSRCGSWCWRRACRGRGVELGMAEQHLDDADVGVLFQQVGGKAVPERVRRHSLLDPGGLGGGMDGTVELAVESGSTGLRPGRASRAAAARPGAGPPATRRAAARRRGRVAFGPCGLCPARPAAACAGVDVADLQRRPPRRRAVRRRRRCRPGACLAGPAPPGAAA